MSSPQSCAPSFSPRRDEAGAARSHKRRRSRTHAQRTRAHTHSLTRVHTRVCVSLSVRGGWVGACAYMVLRNRLTGSLDHSSGQPFSGLQTCACSHARTHKHTHTHTHTLPPSLCCPLSRSVVRSFSHTHKHSLLPTNRSSRIASPASSIRSSNSISPRFSPPSSDGGFRLRAQADDPAASRSSDSPSPHHGSPQRSLVPPPSPPSLPLREAEEVTRSLSERTRATSLRDADPESPTRSLYQRTKTYPCRSREGDQSHRIEMI
jgi:hypothetical protein